MATNCVIAAGGTSTIDGWMVGIMDWTVDKADWGRLGLVTGRLQVNDKTISMTGKIIDNPFCFILPLRKTN